jgi:hypothetical protein
MKTTTLADIKRETGLEMLDHLEVEVAIPVLAGVQAQGDLIVVPLALLDDEVTVVPWARWRGVPPAGIELLRGAAGGNPHTLVTEPGGGRWTTEVRDLTGLALGVLHCTAAAFLVHPEHGGSGIAPGRYVVRRQREQGAWREDSVRLIAD